MPTLYYFCTNPTGKPLEKVFVEQPKKNSMNKKFTGNANHSSEKITRFYKKACRRG